MTQSGGSEGNQEKSPVTVTGSFARSNSLIPDSQSKALALY